MEQKDNDLQKIKELIEIMKENNLVEIEIKHNDDKIFLKRYSPQQQPAITGIAALGPNASATAEAGSTEQSLTPEAEVSTQEVDDNLVEIKSPLVGTFYATPSPDSEHYVEVGSHIENQTVVCIVEAMKVMNEIKTEEGGTIVEILVTNGQAVEYGQVLFKVRPD